MSSWRTNNSAHFTMVQHVAHRAVKGLRIIGAGETVGRGGDYNKTHALRLAQMLKCRLVPRILKGHGRVVPFGQDECDGSPRLTERTHHCLGQSALAPATMRSFPSLPYCRYIAAASHQFHQFPGIAHASPVSSADGNRMGRGRDKGC